MATTTARYRDRRYPPAERATDLLRRMTLAEKIAQLGSFWAFEVVGDGGLHPDLLAAQAPDGIGEITRLAGSTNLRPVDVARTANQIQRYLIEETRLGIPAIIHEECLHGLLAWSAPTFQQSIGAAASFDPDVVTAVASTIQRRMLMTGARHALGPVLDTGRDPRWGRIEETYGEDPYLAAALGSAYIRALQGPDLSTGVLATGKHMVGHGMAEGGMNMAPVHIGPREMHDEQLFPFEVAVRDAGLASMMPAYCDVDGVPCHASHELLTTILREAWGFDGVVASDYTGIAMLQTMHLMTDDPATAGAYAVRAGVDLELPRFDAYGTPLLEALADGRTDEPAIDALVRRVLEMKVRLGLFERPYVDEPTEETLDELATEEGRAGLALARRSLVLVENDGVLPLAADVRRVALIGPIAASVRDLLGDYSHLVHMETLSEMRGRGNAFGVTQVSTTSATVVPTDELLGRETILHVLRSRLDGVHVIHAEGTGIQDGTDAAIAEGVAAAEAADLAIVVLGERSGLTDDSTTGEFRDRRDLGFLGRQQELLEAVVATGRPVVLVVVSGRPLALEWAATHCAAILLAWVPGDAGPEAIVDVLVGAENPGGKLPISMPRNVGQVPLTYRHHASGGQSHPKGAYVDGPTTPLWPFGFGRSYTSFALTDLCVDRMEVPTVDGEMTVRVNVANTGDRYGDEVIQLYVRDEEASIARPILELRGFRRVSLEPGEHRTVSFTLSSEQFAFTGVDLRRIVEPGRVTLSIGTSSADRPLSTTITLVGPTVDLVERHRYLTRSELA
jgi:beta-glucosidase